MFGLNSFAKKFLEHDRPVAMFILGGEDEGDRLPGTAFAKRVHRRSIGFQFFAVTHLELPPAWRVMTEPDSQFRARRHFLCPVVEPGVGLGHPARPQAFDQNAHTVIDRGRFVSVFQLYLCVGHVQIRRQPILSDGLKVRPR